MTERRYKRNSTSTKPTTVNTIICRWPSYNIWHRG